MDTTPTLQSDCLLIRIVCCCPCDCLAECATRVTWTPLQSDCLLIRHADITLASDQTVCSYDSGCHRRRRHVRSQAQAKAAEPPGVGEVGRCKLNPGLKAPRFQRFSLMKTKLAFNLNLVFCELVPLDSNPGLKAPGFKGST